MPLHTVKTNWYFKFNLTPNHYKRGKINKFQNVVFLSKKKNKRKNLIGFQIEIKNSTEKRALKIANQKAEKLTNYISTIQGRYFSSNLVSYISSKVNGKKYAGFRFAACRLTRPGQGCRLHRPMPDPVQGRGEPSRASRPERS